MRSIQADIGCLFLFHSFSRVHIKAVVRKEDGGEKEERKARQRVEKEVEEEMSLETSFRYFRNTPVFTILKIQKERFLRM